MINVSSKLKIGERLSNKTSIVSIGYFLHPDAKKFASHILLPMLKVLMLSFLAEKVISSIRDILAHVLVCKVLAQLCLQSIHVTFRLNFNPYIEWYLQETDFR